MSQPSYAYKIEQELEKVFDDYDTEFLGRSEVVKLLAKRENDAFLRGWRTAVGRKERPKQKAPRQQRSAS